MKSKLFFLKILMLLITALSIQYEMPSFAADSSIDYTNLQNASLIIVGKPVLMDAMEISTPIDAIQAGAAGVSDLSTYISFRIKKVKKGELPVSKRGGPSRFQQLKSHAANKRILKLLTLDIHDPDENKDKRWFRIGLSNPREIFGFTMFDKLPKKTYKLYFTEDISQPGFFTLIKSEEV